MLEAHVCLALHPGLPTKSLSTRLMHILLASQTLYRKKKGVVML